MFKSRKKHISTFQVRREIVKAPTPILPSGEIAQTGAGEIYLDEIADELDRPVVILKKKPNKRKGNKMLPGFRLLEKLAAMELDDS